MRVHRGAAAGVGPGEHSPHQQEAERERQAAAAAPLAGRGAGFADSGWPQLLGLGVFPSRWLGRAGLDGTLRVRSPLWPSLAAQTSLL